MSLRKLCLIVAFSLASAAAQAAMVITVDKSTQRMSVKVDGVEHHNWPVSTGKTGYSTPSGAFTPFRLEEDHYSKEWDEAPMPHSIFFTKTGHAIHGSTDAKRIGMPASHGCVRLSPANAATLFKLVKDEGLGNTKVVLAGDEQIALQRRRGGAEVATAAPAQPRASVDAYTQRMRQRYYQQQYGAVEVDAPQYRQGNGERPVYAPREYYGQREYIAPQYGNSGYYRGWN